MMMRKDKGQYVFCNVDANFQRLKLSNRTNVNLDELG
jgi:hypothetical protein